MLPIGFMINSTFKAFPPKDPEHIIFCEVTNIDDKICSCCVINGAWNFWIKIDSFEGNEFIMEEMIIPHTGDIFESRICCIEEIKPPEIKEEDLIISYTDEHNPLYINILEDTIPF